ncbi:MAG TPA: hypothetical protein VNB06_14760 [Thermoanaerobaculia bacterium]|nr:hypothetical protein [Thermoanaerobaculia bacterium]
MRSLYRPEPEAPVTECPKCTAPLATPIPGGVAIGSAEECPACGVILEKALVVSAGLRRPRSPRAPLRGDVVAETTRLDRRAVGVGLVVGLCWWILPFTRYALSYALVVFHELGHTAMGWAFGYPTIPVFDFAYGGGVSIHFGRSTPLAYLAAVAVAWLAWHLRNTRARWPAGALGAIYLVATVSPLHDALVLAAGHGAELLLAGVCLYRALAPVHWPPVERGTYAACAAFVLASDALFGWQLLASAAFRRTYEQAKGGGHWMDLSRLADDFLGVDLGVVAVLFCLTVLATPLAAHLVAVNRSRIFPSA